MPVVIRELIIRATVSDPSNQRGSSGDGSTRGNAINREELVKEIVEEVLEIIAKQQER